MHEHNERARAPHTHEAREFPWCGALSLFQLPLHYGGIQKISCRAFVQWTWAQLLPAPVVLFTRFLVVVPKPLPAAVLDRGAKADARSAAQVIGRCEQAVARCAAR